ncbi:very short patch repair endonuclease [Aestuariimicrobium sp. Y1814]|uniref:very short patch repair endonuclease n=1 Tax=Aestuariimicrobium sp. Y1814 TaxID=3418742 RepID=UPI003DA70E6A
MVDQRSRDTTPELLLRRALHAAGYRYRVNLKVPGAPRRTIDIAFPRQRLAVMVDGCFWHGCPEHGHIPKHNSEWWSNKLAHNLARDGDTTALLEAAGWTVLRVWEHEAPEDAFAHVASALARAGRTATNRAEVPPRANPSHSP